MTTATKQKARNTPSVEKKQMFPTPGDSLGLKINDLIDSAAQIRSGLSFNKLADFQRTSQLPMDVIAKMVKLSKRTMVRRKKSRKLSQDESERLVRLSLVFEQATNLFDGDKAAAREWLSQPSKALGQIPPLVIAETDMGARAVERLIGQLEHGVFP
ncbi:MAG TPA: antitoxin Xre/MbcA/ParS toxin-binding domain-containing protein [Gemmataceae bacterium]|nr:antitoxin Xre/MbcA/ParS toxin-binding domain-containing protein [Gemmataceae bacterium]